MDKSEENNTGENVETAQHATALEDKRNIRLKQIIIIVVTMVVALAIGGVCTYLIMLPTQQALEWNRAQLVIQDKNNTELKNQNRDLAQENAKLSAKVKELTPTTEEGTSGLTIVTSNVTTRYDSRVLDYTVRNDTNKTVDSIALSFRFLDAGGNSINSTAMTNNARVEPGKTGVVTVYLDDEKKNFPTVQKVQVQKGILTINGEDFNVNLSDSGVSF